MMSTVSGAIFSPTPYHLLAYGTLLGTELYQASRTALRESSLLPEKSIPLLHRLTINILC